MNKLIFIGEIIISLFAILFLYWVDPDSWHAKLIASTITLLLWLIVSLVYCIIFIAVYKFGGSNDKNE